MKIRNNILNIELGISKWLKVRLYESLVLPPDRLRNVDVRKTLGIRRVPNCIKRRRLMYYEDIKK